MDSQKIEIDTKKVVDEAVERWVNLCFLQLQHKRKKQKENEDEKQN